MGDFTGECDRKLELLTDEKIEQLLLARLNLSEK